MDQIDAAKNGQPSAEEQRCQQGRPNDCRELDSLGDRKQRVIVGAPGSRVTVPQPERSDREYRELQVDHPGNQRESSLPVHDGYLTISAGTDGGRAAARLATCGSGQVALTP